MCISHCCIISTGNVWKRAHNSDRYWGIRRLSDNLNRIKRSTEWINLSGKFTHFIDFRVLESAALLRAKYMAWTDYVYCLYLYRYDSKCVTFMYATVNDICAARNSRKIIGKGSESRNVHEMHKLMHVEWVSEGVVCHSWSSQLTSSPCNKHSVHDKTILSLALLINTVCFDGGKGMNWKRAIFVLILVISSTD